MKKNENEVQFDWKHQRDIHLRTKGLTVCNLLNLLLLDFFTEVSEEPPWSRRDSGLTVDGACRACRPPPR